MADSTLFAAPGAAAHGTAGGGLLEVTLALLLVVGLIALLAWAARRMRGFGGTSERIQVLADRSVGPKERCLLVRVGETDILVGVAAGSVRALHVFPQGANTEAPPPPSSSGPKLPNFRDMLMRSIGR